MGYNSVADIMGLSSSFSRCGIVASQNRGISQKSDKI